MAWIESHQALREHPKVYFLMNKLNISKAQTIGHLQMLWWWCIDYAIDGKLPDSADLIARAADFPQTSEIFLSALLEAKLIDKNEQGMFIHDWLDFCGPLIEKRLQRMAGTKKAAAKKRRLSAKRTDLSSYRNQPTVTNQPYYKTISQEINFDLLLKQFNPTLLERIKVYLERIRMKNKSKILTDGRKQTLILELVNAKERCADIQIFENAIDMAINYDACNIGYVNAVIKNKIIKK